MSRYLDILDAMEREAHPSLSLPGREAEGPCLFCGKKCPEGELFDRAECFVAWKARRAARRAQAGRTTPPEAAGMPGAETRRQSARRETP